MGDMDTFWIGDIVGAELDSLKYANPLFGDVRACLARRQARMCPSVKRVIVNKPAVIVYWNDGTKTVVKKQKGDKWDPEKGVAMAICKRLYGNTGRYNDVIKRALEGGEDGR
ncbi:hypothetical protein [Gordonibacter massiliensis (ex Traore et al. 2017)]|uniref:hypothetical protein n=1 Tax=Gordonibacter massiliensis (ex Traore et al. 2017) TaxID=1841863 RepID=UPI001C8C0956|nr:hypothetical protein [Gordonibacter massiliensis (ex Traore et al. 2017)]MBX9035060.1 hypothetical protein [Gordonibacter massiliensis (ex Traore et al. 2017)]